MLILEQLFNLLSVVVRDVSNAFPALSNKLFQCEIISGSQLIVPVHLNLSFSLCWRCIREIEASDDVIESLYVHRYGVLAYYNTRIVFDVLYLFVPNVILNF